jgi:hypothetical protein
MAKLGLLLTVLAICLFMGEAALAWHAGRMPYMPSVRDLVGTYGCELLSALRVPLWLLEQKAAPLALIAGVLSTLLAYLLKPARS